MPTTAAPAKRHQEQWQDVVTDSALRDLSYKVETNEHGQIVLSPPKAQHARLQGRVLDVLRTAGEEGCGLPEFSVATEAGVRGPDVVWMPPGRYDEILETGDPPTIAPDLCIEVMSESNDWDEVEEKQTLYLEAGAEEVWIVTGEGTVRFFADKELETSEMIPDFPAHL